MESAHRAVGHTLARVARPIAVSPCGCSCLVGAATVVAAVAAVAAAAAATTIAVGASAADAAPNRVRSKCWLCATFATTADPAAVSVAPTLGVPLVSPAATPHVLPALRTIGAGLTAARRRPHNAVTLTTRLEGARLDSVPRLGRALFLSRTGWPLAATMAVTLALTRRKHWPPRQRPRKTQRIACFSATRKRKRMQ